jgi:hypothetical protein
LIITEASINAGAFEYDELPMICASSKSEGGQEVSSSLQLELKNQQQDLPWGT